MSGIGTRGMAGVVVVVGVLAALFAVGSGVLILKTTSLGWFAVAPLSGEVFVPSSWGPVRLALLVLPAVALVLAAIGSFLGVRGLRGQRDPRGSALVLVVAALVFSAIAVSVAVVDWAP